MHLLCIRRCIHTYNLFSTLWPSISTAFIIKMTISDRIVNQWTNARFVIDTERVYVEIGLDALDPDARRLFNDCLEAQNPLAQVHLLHALGDSIGSNLDRPVGTSYEIRYDGGSLILDI